MALQAGISKGIFYLRGTEVANIFDMLLFMVYNLEENIVCSTIKCNKSAAYGKE